jgi:c-di-AMP phosphodiesterase-like protein
MNQNNLVFWPTSDMNMNDKLNAITRLVIVLCLVGFIFTRNFNFIWVSVLTLVCIVVYFNLNSESKENFEKQNLSKHTNPTDKNPLMNVLLPELNGNPNRKSALKSFLPETEKKINDKVKQQISKNIDPRIFQGLHNELDLEYSMRNFYTMPNTTVPNNQEEFSKFCYGDMISAKEGDPVALARHNTRLGSVMN